VADDNKRYLVLGHSEQDTSLSYFYVMARNAEEACEVFSTEYLAELEANYEEPDEDDIYIDAVIVAPEGTAVEYTG
jgi:hypothetical protein